MPKQQYLFDVKPQRKVFNDLSGGVDFEHPPDKLPDSKFTDALNIQYFRGLARVDTGYLQYRQKVAGIPQAGFQFVQQTGGVQTLLLTTFTLYFDNGVEWQYVSDGVFSATTTAQVLAGGNVFTLNSAAGLAVGQPVAFALSDSTQLRTTVQQISANTVTTADPVPVGKTVNQGAAVIRPPIFNGDTIFQPVEVAWPELNSLIFTNGVDPIQIWDGAACQPLPGWANITARVLIAFHGFLIAFDTTEGGVRFPQRSRWSDQNNPEETVNGLAGEVDLTDTEDFILAALILGPWLIIYRQTSVMRRSYIGGPLQLFFDEYMLQGIGVWSQNAIADTGSTHVFSGPAGIFRYSGGYDAEDVGDPIFDQLFGPQGIVNNPALFLTTCFYVEELDEVWLLLPTGSNSDNLDSVFRLDQGTGGWWPRKFANPLIGFGFLESIAGRSWQQATQPWDQDTTTWLSHSKTPEAPILLFCDPDNQITLLYDFLQSTDNGAVIPFSLTTKDYEAEEMFIRFDGLYIKGSGNGILVEVSFDRGVTFQVLGTLNFGLTFSVKQLNSQFVCEAFRLRFSGSDPNFSIDWFRTDFFQESLW